MNDEAGLLEKTAEHLEWPRLQAAVLERCRGASARRRGLAFARTRAEASVLLDETRELTRLLERREQLPIDDLRDVDAHLSRLERHGVLDAAALSDVLHTLQNARQSREFLAAHRAAAPALWSACATDPSLDELESSLRDAIDPDGRIADHASEALRSLRSEIQNLRARITGRLEELITRYEAVLSDRYYTLREGRYVLPVRRDAHEKVPGIVHAESSSGASVFVEPRAVVAHGNRLKMAEAELEREELRILAELSDLVRDRLPSLLGAARALDRLDLRHAAASLGRELGGSVPELSDEAVLDLRAARHPLLALDGVKVVDNDLRLEAGRGLVISGPNAGGKTVLLKTLGLFALMTRHGLPVTAAEGARIGFFRHVLTDVGDEQSTQRNLSTFSAHVKNLAAILERAGPDSLALLDEVATGTDPEEGAALACAVVEALCESGAVLAVTTHYEALKALSLRDMRLRSASVGFDVGRMEPSFRLILDVPGASSALSVAARFGIPDSVIEAARRVLPEQAKEFDRLVRELGARSLALAEREAELADEHERLAQLNRQSKEALERLRREGDSQIRAATERLAAEVREARGELERARTALRARDASRASLGEAQRAIDAVAARVALGGDLAPIPQQSEPADGDNALDEGLIRPGLAVHVPHLRSDAVVIEGPRKGRTRIAAGPLKLWVRNGELRASTGSRNGSATAAEPPAQPRRNEGRSPDNTLNIRGMRVDDALSLVESFVDRMYTTDLHVGYVMHGHGTGALREAVRKHLREAVPHVRDIGPADTAEGGDAVTVFYLT